MSTKKAMTKKMAKQAKKTKVKNVSVNTNDELKNMGIILGIVTAVVLVFYGITYLVTQKNEKKEEVPTKIQYSEILVGTMLNQEDLSYYVLALREKDMAYTLYNTYLNLVSSKNGTPYYMVNLDHVFNKKYIGEESNITADFGSLTFADATVLKIENGQILESHVGQEAITAYFDTLLAE